MIEPAPAVARAAPVAGEFAGRHILIIVENLPLPFDRRVWHEARTLRDAGAAVSIICPTGKNYQSRHEVIDGIAIYRHPLPLEAKGALGYLAEYSAALFWESLLAWKIFAGQRFDVIQGCNPPDLIFLVALQFKLFGVRYIFDHHDINPELYEAKFERRGLFWRMMVLFERLTFKAADVSIATNESYKRIAVERGGKASEDVFVVRSGPDLKRLVAMPLTGKWHNSRPFLVGYVGVMGEQEGIDLLIEAVEIIVRKMGREDIQFCLVGGGPHLAALQRMVQMLGLGDFITFTGRAPDEDLFSVLSNMDVGVNPDRVNPMNDLSTMNKIMEYMAFGKPMVQFDVREGRFSAGESSDYAAPNDANDLAHKIVALIDDPARRERMGAAGRQRVERELSWDYQIEPLLSAYRRVFAR